MNFFQFLFSFVRRVTKNKSCFKQGIALGSTAIGAHAFDGEATRTVSVVLVLGVFFDEIVLNLLCRRRVGLFRGVGLLGLIWLLILGFCRCFSLTGSIGEFAYYIPDVVFAYETHFNGGEIFVEESGVTFLKRAVVLGYKPGSILARVKRDTN